MSVGAFPLPFKFRKLKLRIENMPIWKCGNFAKTPLYRKKSFYAHMRWFFRQSEKGIIRKSSIETFFFALKGHMAYVKSHIIIIRCTPRNTSYVVALEYKGLSLPLIHMSAAQCGSDTATEADCGQSSRCLFIPATPHML